MSDFLCLHLSLEKGRDDSPVIAMDGKIGWMGCAIGPGCSGSQDTSSSLWGPLFDVAGTVLVLRETKGEKRGSVPSNGL